MMGRKPLKVGLRKPEPGLRTNFGGRFGGEDEPTRKLPRLFELVKFAVVVVFATLISMYLQVRIPFSRLPDSYRHLLQSRCSSVTLGYTTLVSSFPMAAGTYEDSAQFNYALKQCGAQIIPELTFAKSTPIYPSAPTVGPEEDLDLLSDSVPSNRDPDSSSHGGGLSPHCWSFYGSVGQLGFSLVELLNISSISIQHNLSHDPATAPRLAVLWGLIDGDEAMARYNELSDLRLQLQSYLPSEAARPMPEDQAYMPLAMLNYNSHAAETRQTFSVFRNVTQSGLTFGILALQVLGNWGADSTQLCGMGIHGIPVGTGW